MNRNLHIYKVLSIHEQTESAVALPSVGDNENILGKE